MSALIFDRALYAQRLARAAALGPDIVNRTIAAELADRASFITRDFAAACVIAPDPQSASAAVESAGRIRVVDRRMPQAVDELHLGHAQYDAIFHVLDLHAVNDVPGVLVQLHRALKPDGLLLACLFAGDTLTELRQSFLAAEALVTGGVSPRVAPMISVRELGSLLQRAGFALPVVDLDRTLVRYADAIALIHELSSLGMSNMLVARSRKFMSRHLLGAAAAHYQNNFADADGRIRATLEVAWATAWTPHETQPKPLKPGSAKTRLADALKAMQHGASDTEGS